VEFRKGKRAGILSIGMGYQNKTSYEVYEHAFPGFFFSMEERGVAEKEKKRNT